MSAAALPLPLPVATASLLNAIPHGIAVLNQDLRIRGMNRFLEALTGYTSGEVVGVAAEFVIRSSRQPKELFPRASLQKGEPLSLEGDLLNLNRHKVPVRFTVTAVPGLPGPQPDYLLVVEDISLLRQLDHQRHGGQEATGMLGHSLKMQELFALLPVLAQTDATLLITGETGTGKDLLAEAIHKASKRAKYPFVKINCGALPETLLESELFGHVRGAFTGAYADKPGMFQLAQGGTIYLTEIGDLPLPLQVKLLTVLDDREFFPLGSSKKVSVNVRLITGTHRQLKDLVQERKFREDLYFRLNVLRAHLPPLRERDGDIRLLVDHFLRLFVANLGKRISGFSKEAITCLLNYRFPGNVRELRNLVEYAANICPHGKIGLEHLSEYIQISTPPSPLPASPGPAAPAPTAPPPRESGHNWTEIEKQNILNALQTHGGNRSKAAQELGWSRSTLWRKIILYNLN